MSFTFPSKHCLDATFLFITLVPWNRRLRSWHFAQDSHGKYIHALGGVKHPGSNAHHLGVGG
jgi:hypothetical protein